MHSNSSPSSNLKKKKKILATISFRIVGMFCFKVKRNWCCALPEVDEEQGLEEALADEGAAPEGG